MNIPLINLENVSLAFKIDKGKDYLPVLKNISFTVKEGQLTTIIGPSGCGKTTLLKLIGGLITEANVTGKILVNNLLPKEIKKQRKIGFAFQNPVLLPWRNVLENTLLPFELQTRLNHEHETKAGSILSLMGVSDFSKAYPYELSGGMKQRINLARALIHEPALILMDEPFGSLDEITRLRLNFELLNMLKIKKQTSILVTHSLREALMLGDEILILSKRPASVVRVFQPTILEPKEPGIETSNSFNAELKKLTEIFLNETQQ